MPDLFDGWYVVDGVYGALAVQPVGFDGIQPWTCCGQAIRHDARATVLPGPPVVSPHPVLQDLGDVEGSVVPDHDKPALSSTRRHAQQPVQERARPGGVGVAIAAPDFYGPVFGSQRTVDDEGSWVALLEASPRRDTMGISLRREGAQTWHRQRREPTLVLIHDLDAVALGEAFYESLNARFFWA